MNLIIIINIIIDLRLNNPKSDAISRSLMQYPNVCFNIPMSGSISRCQVEFLKSSVGASDVPLLLPLFQIAREELDHLPFSHLNAVVTFPVINHL